MQEKKTQAGKRTLEDYQFGHVCVCTGTIDVFRIALHMGNIGLMSTTNICQFLFIYLFIRDVDVDVDHYDCN